MVQYSCDFCQYKTRRKTEYTRHLNTKGHFEKVNQSNVDSKNIPIRFQNDSNNFGCLYCENRYSTQSNATKHMKKCANKEVNEIKEVIKENEVDTLKKENERIQKEAKEKEEILKKQIETYETLLKSLTTPQAINYYNFICTNYPNTPALECQKTYTDLIEAKKLSLIDIIEMYYYDNKLVNFIGDYIIRIYKMEEPKNQSIWSTDISRLTYIISESCNKTKENTWSYDKKGAKIKKIMIEPALNYLRQQLQKFCQENGGSTKAHILKKMIAANSTIQIIDNGELIEKINKYIAPEFAIHQLETLNAVVKV